MGAAELRYLPHVSASSQGSLVTTRVFGAVVGGLFLGLAALLACSSQEAGSSGSSSISSPTSQEVPLGSRRVPLGLLSQGGGPLGGHSGTPPDLGARPGLSGDGRQRSSRLSGWAFYLRMEPSRPDPHARRAPTQQSRYGETELYRTLQRWDGIQLPAGVEVSSARLQITVEKGPRRAVDVMLYEVHKDWEPGKGGTQNDNTSPPRPGEVWWGEAGHATQPWGLPGVGFASERHPRPTLPSWPWLKLATSPTLASRIALWSSRVRPWRITCRNRGGGASRCGSWSRCSDAAEDEPGTQLDLYSANVGDEHHRDWRPRLELSWSAPGHRAQGQRSIHLENGPLYSDRAVAVEKGRASCGELRAIEPQTAKCRRFKSEAGGATESPRGKARLIPKRWTGSGPSFV